MLKPIPKPEDWSIGEMEILQKPYKLTLWEAIKAFFNFHLNENIKRKELIEYLKGNFYRGRTTREGTIDSFATMDTYRNYLYKAGYLIKIKLGVYRLVKEIPHRLTLKQVIYEAYKSKKEERYNIYGEFVRTSETTTHLYRKTLNPKKRKEFLSKEEMEL